MLFFFLDKLVASMIPQVPAALYLLADRLHHVSTRRLDVAAFQVLSQSKVLTAALFGKLFRGREYTGRQWASLGALAVGIACCQVADLGEATLAPRGAGNRTAPSRRVFFRASRMAEHLGGTLAKFGGRGYVAAATLERPRRRPRRRR